MIVNVNGDKIRIANHDDINTIIQLYSEKDKDSIPEYFSAENKNIVIKDKSSITLNDIRSELLNLNLESLKKKLDDLTQIYEDITPTDIIILFLRLNYWGKINVEKELCDIEEDLKNIDRQKFFNCRRTLELLREYETQFIKKRKILESIVGEKKGITEKLNKIKGFNLEKFIEEELTLRLSIKVPKGSSRKDIFNELTVSKHVPFIKLENNSLEWYKVYKDIVPPDSWIEFDEDKKFVLKIFNETQKKEKKGEDIDLNYSDGIWDENNNINISFRIGKEIEEDIIKRVESSFDFTDFYITKKESVGIKGKFSAKGISFNTAIFADLISNFGIFKYFFFFNERSQYFKKYKSAITKPRFSFYYSPGQNFDIKSSITIIVTPQISETEEWIDVRVSRATNLRQIENFMAVFSKTLSIYETERDRVVKEYSNLLPSSKKLFLNYVKVLKVKRGDKKSGKRLQELKNARPSVFRSGYASMCQPMSHQPYLIENKEKAKKIIKKLGENKVMAFKDPESGEIDYYACEPREEGEVKSHLYPGLRKNIGKGGEKYQSEVPFLPCCFTKDQYVKKGSNLFKLMKEGIEDDDPLEAGEIGYVLASIKRAPAGRYGQLPYYISILAKNAGYEEIEKGKQSLLPLLRYGVVSSPDSIIHCLEKAFSLRYSAVPAKKRQDIVSQAKLQISKMDFSPAMQEMFGLDIKKLKERLLNLSYLDPLIWVRLLEIYYSTNIYLFGVGEDNPNGTILIPRNSKVFLEGTKKYPKSVVIVRYRAEDASYAYQCEIITRFLDKQGKFSYVFENDKFVDIVEYAFQRAYSFEDLSVDKLFL